MKKLGVIHCIFNICLGEKPWAKVCIARKFLSNI